MTCGADFTHFLDTNVLLGRTLTWECDSDLESYLSTFGHSVDAHTSDRVFSEAERVVRRLRRLAKQAGRCVFQQYGRQSGYVDTGDIVDTIWSEMIDSVRRNTLSGVCEYVKLVEADDNHPPLYTNLSRTNAKSQLERLNTVVDDDFEKIERSLDMIRRPDGDTLPVAEFDETCCPSTYAAQYSSVYAGVDDLVDNSADRNVLLDAHHFCVERDETSVTFTSMDTTDIVSPEVADGTTETVRDELESTLVHLSLRTPSEILT